MEADKKSIVESLSGTDLEILEHLPYLLQDLWELGGGTYRIIELVEGNISSAMSSSTILDVCCGKGPVAINLSLKYQCRCKGIDLFEPFIEEAKKIAIQNRVEHLNDFEVMDIKKAENTQRDYDLVIYGGDAAVIGDEINSLQEISKCCKANGYIIYSNVVSCLNDLSRAIEKIGLQIIDYSIMDRTEIKKINEVNNKHIKQRASELTLKHPDQKKLFRKYVRSQEVESAILENNLIWVNMLLRQNR